MSVQDFRTRIEEDHLTCSICFNVFNVPKVLPCQHTFCEQCIREYVSSRSFESSGEFPCPNCRVAVTIPPGGIRQFPDNLLAKNLTETVSNAAGDTPNLGLLVHRNADRPQNSESHPHTYPQILPPHAESTDRNRSEGILLRFGKKGTGVSDFHKPYGLAVSSGNEYVVSDIGGNRILVFASRGELKTTITCGCHVRDVAVTKRNEILVTVNKPGAVIQHYNLSGRLIGEYGKFITNEDPHGICVPVNGGAVFTGKQNNNVHILTDQYKFSSRFGRKGTGDGYFRSPAFVTTNSKNHIIVSDSASDDIQVFNRHGKFKFRFGRSGSRPGELVQPLGVAVDDNDNIIVADSGNNRVEMFTSKGSYVRTVVSRTDEFGSDVRPINVAVTPQGDVAVLLSGTSFAEVQIHRCTSTSRAHGQTTSVRDSRTWDGEGKAARERMWAPPSQGWPKRR